MKLSALLLSLLLSSSLLADQHEHKKSLDAHEHGAIHLAFAIEGKTIDIELNGPSESFLGFEHKPTSKEEIATFNRLKELWTKDLLTNLFVFDSKLNCKIDSALFEQEFEESKTNGSKKSGTHSEITADAKISCADGNFKGTDVKIGLKEKFPKIKKLKLEIIDADKTKAVDIKRPIETVRL